MQIGFLIRGDIAVCGNAQLYVKEDNDMLCNILHSTGINSIPLPAYSSELNLIELVFNIMVQRFTSKYSESSVKNNKEMILFLNEIIDSITPCIIFSCYQKCSHANFY